MKVKLLVLLLLLVAACTQNKPMTDEQKAAVKEEGSVIVKEVFDAIAASNFEKMISLLENNSDFTYVVLGAPYTYDEMKETATQYMPYVERQTFITKFEKYIIVDPSCFVYIWQGDNGMYMKEGDSTILNDFSITYTFRKNEGSWKLLVGNESYKASLPIDTTKVK